MSENIIDSPKKVLDEFEDAPHIELNEKGLNVDLSNWQKPANRCWSYRNIKSFLPFHTDISKGNGPVNEFKEQLLDISHLTVTYKNCDMKLDDYLKESHCNGFIVIHNNSVIYENYRRMAPEETHLCQSITKTTVCIIMGQLIHKGLIDPESTVDDYIPDVADGFSGVRIQDLLDMNVALKFSEDFTDLSADIYKYEMISAWWPDKGSQKDGLLSYLKKIRRDPGHKLDGITHYLCPNTDMLVSIAEKVTGIAFSDLFQNNFYRHIGAEANAFFATDAKKMAIGSGGLNIRLRDLARYGQVFANMGLARNNKRLIPKDWLLDCQDTSKGTAYYLGKGYQYHNQVTSNGQAFCHLGVGGQMLYANTETKVVVAQFSTLTSRSNGDMDTGYALYSIAENISNYLKLNQTELNL